MAGFSGRVRRRPLFTCLITLAALLLASCGEPEVQSETSGRGSSTATPAPAVDDETASDSVEAASSSSAENGSTTENPSTAENPTSQSSVDEELVLIEPRESDVLSARDYRTCVVLAGDTVCWGEDLRTGEYQDPAVVDVGDSVAVAVGLSHTCALDRHGQVRCWGMNQSGQLGSPASDQAVPPDDAVVVDLDPAATVAAGAAHTCAITIAGEVWCWGQAENGLLATESQVPSPPVRIEFPAAATDIQIGPDSTCAILTDGAVWCWGYPASRLRPSEPLADANPWPIDLADAAAAIEVGGFSCAVFDDGRAQCWNGRQIGDSVDTPRDVPFGDVQQIALGFRHACFLKSDGTVSCWGENGYGQLGDGQAAESVPTGAEQPVPGVVDANQIVAGFYHTCVLASASFEVTCWGVHGSSFSPVEDAPLTVPYAIDLPARE